MSGEFAGSSDSGESTPGQRSDQLLSLSSIASRHLIARTSQTDIISRSIEQIAAEATNEAELQCLIEGITRPYEELFVRLARELPKKGTQLHDKFGKLKTGGWSFNETTDNGLLSISVKYGFKGKKSKPQIKVANINISSLHDATAELHIDFFDNNTISELRLGWEANYGPTQPHTLLKKLEGTELGEVIDAFVGPYAINRAVGKQWLTFRLGQHPFITASREGHYSTVDKEKNVVRSFGTRSDLQYHPGKNIFIRQHGLKGINKDDKLTALNPEEAAVVLHQLLSLVPTVSLD